MKYFRASMSAELLKEILGAKKSLFFGQGVELVKTSYPEDARIIHTEWNVMNQKLDFYFSSNEYGQEVPEGGSILNVEYIDNSVYYSIPMIEKETVKKKLFRLKRLLNRKDYDKMKMLKQIEMIEKELEVDQI